MEISFSPPDMSELEIEKVKETIQSGWITTGPKTKEFERQIAAYCGTKQAICLNSQTACGELALRLLGIGKGDEVIVPAYTYTASASIVCHVGADLIFADVQRDSLEMDYEKLKSIITEKTKAIIPVDLGGIPCDYEKIFSIVEKTALSACQCHSESDGKNCSMCRCRTFLRCSLAGEAGRKYCGLVCIQFPCCQESYYSGRWRFDMENHTWHF